MKSYLVAVSLLHGIGGVILLQAFWLAYIYPPFRPYALLEVFVFFSATAALFGAALLSRKGFLE